MVEDVAVVVHCKAVSVHSKLGANILWEDQKKALPCREESASQFRQLERPFLPPPEVLQCGPSVGRRGELNSLGGTFSDGDIARTRLG